MLCFMKNTVRSVPLLIGINEMPSGWKMMNDPGLVDFREDLMIVYLQAQVHALDL